MGEDISQENLLFNKRQLPDIILRSVHLSTSRGIMIRSLKFTLCDLSLVCRQRCFSSELRLLCSPAGLLTCVRFMSQTNGITMWAYHGSTVFFIWSHQLCHQWSAPATLLKSQWQHVLCPASQVQGVSTPLRVLWNARACFCPIIFLFLFFFEFFLSVFERCQENWCC